MSRWFRHYAGMARDDKLVRASIKSKQPVERVVWVWIAILESASEINSEGRFEVEKEEIARFLRCPSTKVAAIISALEELGRISADSVVKWSHRQFSSDRSAERTKRYRERHRDADVTSQERRGDSPELETETELERESSVAKATGTVVPIMEADTKFWSDAKAYLAVTERNPGGLVGKWLKAHGKVETARAITQAQIERAVQPVPFIEGYFRKQARTAEPEYGPC